MITDRRLDYRLKILKAKGAIRRIKAHADYRCRNLTARERQEIAGHFRTIRQCQRQIERCYSLEATLAKSKRVLAMNPRAKETVARAKRAVAWRPNRTESRDAP